MDTDPSTLKTICENLCKLRINNAPARDLPAEARRAKEGRDKGSKEIVEKIGA
jgi:hypothetical protein